MEARAGAGSASGGMPADEQAGLPPPLLSHAAGRRRAVPLWPPPGQAVVVMGEAEPAPAPVPEPVQPLRRGGGGGSLSPQDGSLRADGLVMPRPTSGDSAGRSEPWAAHAAGGGLAQIASPGGGPSMRGSGLAATTTPRGDPSYSAPPAPRLGQTPGHARPPASHAHRQPNRTPASSHAHPPHTSGAAALGSTGTLAGVAAAWYSGTGGPGTPSPMLPPPHMSPWDVHASAAAFGASPRLPQLRATGDPYHPPPLYAAASPAAHARNGLGAGDAADASPSAPSAATPATPSRRLPLAPLSVPAPAPLSPQAGGGSATGAGRLALAGSPTPFPACIPPPLPHVEPLVPPRHSGDGGSGGRGSGGGDGATAAAAGAGVGGASVVPPPSPGGSVFGARLARPKVPTALPGDAAEEGSVRRAAAAAASPAPAPASTAAQPEEPSRPPPPWLKLKPASKAAHGVGVGPAPAAGGLTGAAPVAAVAGADALPPAAASAAPKWPRPGQGKRSAVGAGTPGGGADSQGDAKPADSTAAPAAVSDGVTTPPAGGPAHPVQAQLSDVGGAMMGIGGGGGGGGGVAGAELHSRAQPEPAAAAPSLALASPRGDGATAGVLPSLPSTRARPPVPAASAPTPSTSAGVVVVHVNLLGLDDGGLDEAEAAGAAAAAAAADVAARATGPPPASADGHDAGLGLDGSFVVGRTRVATAPSPRLPRAELSQRGTARLTSPRSSQPTRSGTAFGRSAARPAAARAPPSPRPRSPSPVGSPRPRRAASPPAVVIAWDGADAMGGAGRGVPEWRASLGSSPHGRDVVLRGSGVRVHVESLW